MKFLNNIPYNIGSSFNENNIDLELRSKYSDCISFYSSYRYSEIFLFGKVFESVCYLWFTDNKLTRIEYRFEKQYFELFKSSINSELPLGKKLLKDPFINGNEFDSFVNNRSISLVELNEDYFLLKIADSLKLPRIKSNL